jgi:hypothetical protein
VRFALPGGGLVDEFKAQKGLETRRLQITVSLPWSLCDDEKDLSVMRRCEEIVERIRALNEVGVELCRQPR